MPRVAVLLVALVPLACNTERARGGPPDPPDAGPPATTTGNACQDLSACCTTITNQIAKFTCDLASKAGDEDTCADVLKGCELSKNLPNGN